MSIPTNESPDDLLAAYALGALDADEVLRVEAHLAGSTESRAELQAFRDVVAQLPYAAQPVEPPATVRRQLFARIAAEQTPPARPLDPPPARRSAPRGRWMLPAAVALLLLLTFGLGGMVLSLQGNVSRLARNNDELASSLAETRQQLAATQAQQQALATELAASRRELGTVETQLAVNQRDLATLNRQIMSEQQIFTFITAPGVATRQLAARGPIDEAGGEMYMRPGQREAVILFRGLPQLEPGRVYQFWLANGDTQIAAGTVIADADGLARLVIEAPQEVNAFRQVMLTVEPAEGSSLPTGEVVLEGSL